MANNNIDYIIILSHLMDSKANLNSESKKRASKSIEIYEGNKNAKFITCGWAYRKDCKIPIAEAMSDFLKKEYKIKDNQIISQIYSRDTVGDAVFSRKAIQKKIEESNIAVVTSSYHINRTKEIFNFVFEGSRNIYFYACKIQVNKKLIISEEDSLHQFKLTFKDIKKGEINKIYDRLIGKHPYYNGKYLSKFSFLDI